MKDLRIDEVESEPEDEPHTDDLQEIKQHESLFARVARNRASYFADIETVAASPEVDSVPTQHYDAFLQSIGLSLTASIPVLKVQRAETSDLVAQPVGGQPVETMPACAERTPVPATISISVVQPPTSYGAHLGNLLKRSGVYALASMISPCVALVLAPFLTSHLTRADYGTLTVLSTAIALIAGISQLGLGSAFFRVYNYDYEEAGERVQVLSTMLLLLLGLVLPLGLVEYATAPWLAEALFGSSRLVESVRLAALAVTLQNLSVPGFAWMRAEGRAVQFALLSILNLLANLVLTLVLVGSLRMGIIGALLATGGGYILVLCCVLPPLLWRIGKLVLRLDIARALLSFGLPNALTFASAWALQLADRFLLAHMRSLGETATYGVAYTLGGALSVVVLSPFALAWPSTLFLIARRRDAQQAFATIFRWYSLFLLLMAYALSLVAEFALSVFFARSYQGALNVIPLVALSTMFYGLYNYLTLGMNIRKKLWYAVLFLSTAALVNIGANCLLIPLYGSTGAALATLIAYVLLAVATYGLNQRIYPVPFEIDLFGLGLLLVIGCYGVSAWLTQACSFWIACLISLVGLLLCGGSLFALGWLWTLRQKRREQGYQTLAVPQQGFKLADEESEAE